MDGYTFTSDVRLTLARARDEANALGHECVGAEHLLLGALSHPDSDGSRLLAATGADRIAIRHSVLSVVKRGDRSQPTTNDLPYTSRAKTSLEHAMRAARDLGHDHIGTEHLLLGCVRERMSIAAQVLGQHGITEQRLLAAWPSPG